ERADLGLELVEVLRPISAVVVDIQTTVGLHRQQGAAHRGAERAASAGEARFLEGRAHLTGDLHEASFVDYQFAGQIHEVVEPIDVDAHGLPYAGFAFGRRGRGDLLFVFNHWLQGGAYIGRSRSDCRD